MVHGIFMKNHIYKNNFFNYVDRSSSLSAKHTLSKINLPFEIKSILDVGCGRGAWLAEWKKSLAEVNVLGIDGHYVNQDMLAIEKSEFMALDISNSFNLNKKFDLVQCLEVAEHIDNSKSKALIKNLIAHGDIILFSAATPGQGGEHHVNEQKLEYWKNLFEEEQYTCIDCIRSKIINNNKIEPWYRYNTLLYVNNKVLELKFKNNLHQIVPIGTPPNDLSSKYWKLRNNIIKNTPTLVLNMLIKIKHKFNG